MEKVPRKKAKRPLKKKTVFLLCLAAAALCAAGVFFLRPESEQPPLPESRETVYLLSRPAEEISSIAISPADSVGYPLVRSGEDFRLLGREEMELRSGTVDQIVSAATELTAESTLMDVIRERVNLSDFGLNPPRTRVVIGYTDGSRAELIIGDEAPEETPQRYCMISGDQRLHTVLSEECRIFFREMDTLRAFDQPKMDASLLDRIDIAGNMDLALRYTPLGWLMEAPYAYPVAQTRSDRLLQQIDAMAFDYCLGDADELSLADYGLDQPARTITLTQAASVITGETAEGEQVRLDVPEKKYTLLLGNETGKSGVYLLWEGRVFVASNFLLGFWKEMEAESLLLRNPVNYLIHQLTSVSFSSRDVSRTYEVRMVEGVTENNEIATDEYGQILYDCAVRRAGETEDMDAQSFLTWYTALAGLTPSGRVSGDYSPSGTAEAIIRLNSEAQAREIALYPYDALHDAIAVDGVCLFYTDKAWLDTVLPLP